MLDVPRVVLALEEFEQVGLSEDLAEILGVGTPRLGRQDRHRRVDERRRALALLLRD